MKYDVIVIGGGPAGMMAAGRAGETGAKVLLLEKNKKLGVKLLLTGNGRCNITNNIDKPKEFVARFDKNSGFLFSALNKFGVSEVIDFFTNREVAVKVEKDNQVFPVSDRAQDVLNALIGYLKTSQVEVRTSAEVKEIIVKEGRIENIILTDGKKISANNYILCVGGKSYPATGSTGEGFNWLEKIGHQIVAPMPAYTPVRVEEKFVRDIEGLSLVDAEICLYKNNKKIESRRGEAIFTFDGLSGPVILAMSKKIGMELPNELKFIIDFFPSMDFAETDKKFQATFQPDNNRAIKNSLEKLLPNKLISVILRLAEIDPEKKVNLVTGEERKKIVHLLKEFSLSIKEVVGFSKAIVTAGGVELTEVDPKTMKSKIIENLYFAGEILDIDGPTGGFNLQVCWSTGFVAGESVAKNVVGK